MSDTIIGITRRVNDISTDFERDVSELKRTYLLKNIVAFNFIAQKMSTCRGTFGTGYPFYALDEDLRGTLPVIEEQIRYNRELVKQGKRSKRYLWSCRGCLERNYDSMPDLKQICKPCPSMDKELKPRKIINRLPDMDMWFVCEDGMLEEAQQQLKMYMDAVGLRSSDGDPMRTIDDMEEIVEALKSGRMPDKLLPIDAHIIEYSKLKEIIESVPKTIIISRNQGEIPYIPIHPSSLRKKWQLDDEAYNYIYDFLAAFKEFNFPPELQQALDTSRGRVSSIYSERELFEILECVASDAQRARFKSPTLRELFIKKICRWRGLGFKEEPSPKNVELVEERDI